MNSYKIYEKLINRGTINHNILPITEPINIGITICDVVSMQISVSVIHFIIWHTTNAQARK